MSLRLALLAVWFIDVIFAFVDCLLFCLCVFDRCCVRLIVLFISLVVVIASLLLVNCFVFVFIWLWCLFDWCLWLCFCYLRLVCWVYVWLVSMFEWCLGLGWVVLVLRFRFCGYCSLIWLFRSDVYYLLFVACWINFVLVNVCSCVVVLFGVWRISLDCLIVLIVLYICCFYCCFSFDVSLVSSL